MGEVATRLADVAILTSDNPRSEDPGAIVDDVLAGVPTDARRSSSSTGAPRIRIAVDGAQTRATSW